VYDYWLGGKDNFPADRWAGEQVMAVRPSVIAAARANRQFMHRAVRYLATTGIRQFLDIGTGVPTYPNVHECAQQIAPDCRVVYVDNDPLVLSHARALMAGNREGATDFLDADLRDPASILRQATRTLDFTAPIAVMLIGVLHLISDEDSPHEIVAALMDGVPAGSYLASCSPASDIDADRAARGTQLYNQLVPTQQTRRDHATVARFFDGLELTDPGVVQPGNWKPSPGSPVCTASGWAGVGHKP
jgi:hypothetical protein